MIRPILRRLWAALGISIVISLGQEAAAQTQRPDWFLKDPELREMDKELQRLLKGIADKDRAMLGQILRQFAKVPDPENKLRPILEKITLDLPLVDLWDQNTLRSGASASSMPGGAHVKLAQMMTFSVGTHSTVAARHMYAALAGMPSNHPEDPLLDVEATNISWHAVAWIVAHEVAHHRLGHGNRKPASLKEAQSWEMDADRIGFEMLGEAGYSLYILAWFFETRAVHEELRRRYGVDRTSEDASIHPSWRRRLEQLNVAIKEETRSGRWVVVSVLYPYRVGQTLVKKIYRIPNESKDRAISVVTLVSKGPGQLPQIIPGLGGFSQSSNGEATVYLRGPTERIACTFPNVLAAVGRNICTTRTDDNKTKAPETQSYFRDSFAGLFAQDQSNQLALLFNLDMKAVERSVVKELIPAGRQQTDILDYIEASYRLRELLVANVTMGGMSSEEYGKEMSKSTSSYPEAMRKALGQQYPEFEKRVAARVASISRQETER